jgi:hypothetical protein
MNEMMLLLRAADSHYIQTRLARRLTLILSASYEYRQPHCRVVDGCCLFVDWLPKGEIHEF